jgi:putative FmdB family regulatory protein
MPLYEYKCHKCNRTFEVRQKFSDDPLTVHEGCGGDVERLLSVPALQFKGSGWYVTDYAKGGASSATNGTNGKSGTKSESSSTESSSSDSKATPAKSESKSESKPESKPA